MKINWYEKINEIRKYLDTDPSLIAYCIREWPITEQAGLKDLAWAMCRESGYIVKNDAKYLLDKLEEYINENSQDKYENESEGFT